MSGVHSEAEDIARPKLECDLIMKGGITSGIVFPSALTVLARRYRFRSIGGTSAGAIAAVMAAAAEYRRQSAIAANASDEEKRKGFEGIDQLSVVLASDLASLFQPSKRLAGLFSIGLAAAKSSGGATSAVLHAIIGVFAVAMIIGALPGLIILAISIFLLNTAGLLLGILLALAGAVGAVIYKLYQAIFRILPEEDFGLCPGITTLAGGKPAFTDWMHENIQKIAGRDPIKDAPLTVGDLLQYEIELASVTTDLSSKRPYQLPIKARTHYFSRSQFEALFPKNIVEYLVQRSNDEDRDGEVNRLAADGANDLHRMPAWKDWPVLLVARMSLSFPILIRPIPLYRNDFSLLRPGVERTPAIRLRCLFSDGGISSNFPIHFFDGLLPSRPTFGISLGSYDPNRSPFTKRVLLPQTTRQGKVNSIGPLDGLLGFFMTIVNTAKDWQDTLQSQLHGYSERIVEIRLDDSKEGGLNLEMDKATIGSLTGFGRQAGTEILEEFKFSEHRWRRALTALHKIDNQLITLAERFDSGNYRDLLLSYQAESFKSIANSDAARKRYADFAEELAAIGRRMKINPLPEPSRELTNLRITPSIDTNDTSRS